MRIGAYINHLYFKKYSAKENDNFSSASFAYKYNYSKDFVSFGANVKIVERIRNLPIEAFPSEGLRNYIFDNLDSRTDIVELHKEYYSRLFECETLEEAKELYPEFKTVIDANEIESEKFEPRFYKKLKEGQYFGLSLDNISLKLLKNIYGQCLSAKKIVEQKLYGIGRNSMSSILSLLNIKMDERYAEIIKLQNSSNTRCDMCKTEEFKQTRSDAARKGWDNPERRREASKALRERWQTPGYKEQVGAKISGGWNKTRKGKASEKMREFWDNPENREERTQAIKEGWGSPEKRNEAGKRSTLRWQDEEYQNHMQKILLERWQNPKYRKKVSATRKKMWQEPEYRQKMIGILFERWKDPQYRAKISEARKNTWQDEDYIQLMSIVSLAKSFAWNRHPSARNIYQDVAKEFKGLGKIINKIKEGKTLTNAEQKIHSEYFKACSERYPKVLSEIGEIQKQILAEWGFYEKDRDVDEMLNLICEQHLDFFDGAF